MLGVLRRTPVWASSSARDAWVACEDEPPHLAYGMHYLYLSTLDLLVTLEGTTGSEAAIVN
jgi:hypothetical protein